MERKREHYSLGNCLKVAPKCHRHQKRIENLTSYNFKGEKVVYSLSVASS